jgi:hypothetical protein
MIQPTLSPLDDGEESEIICVPINLKIAFGLREDIFVIGHASPHH